MCAKTQNYCLTFELTDKELWEPVIARIFQFAQSDSAERYKIRETWAFDWPTHGEAAVINQALLQDRADCVCE
jgi:hypothetical protein